MRTRASVDRVVVKTAKPTNTPPPEIIEPVDDQLTLLRLGVTENVEQGGFSFRPIVGYEMRLGKRQATMTSDDGEVIVSLSGIHVQKIDDIETVLAKLLGNMSETIQELDAGEPYPFMIDGGQGLAVDMYGKLRGERINGRIAIISPRNELLFYAITISVDGPSQRSWESRGRPVFDTVVGTIDFLDPQDLP
jgi:hypothetical protein